MRVKLEISYNGKNYYGFQKQARKNTIQQELEKALSIIYQMEISVVSSGRTDAMVSAIKQVVHYDAPTDLKDISAWANSLLPRDISVLSYNVVDNSFHARFDAVKKTYRYYFYFSKQRNACLDDFAYFVPHALDLNKMNDAAKCILGEHDFSSFCAANTSVIDKNRKIYNAKIEEVMPNLYFFEVEANGFLYNMIRILMGTLIDVGRGKICLDEFEKILIAKDRSKAAKTVAAYPLVLMDVLY